MISVPFVELRERLEVVESSRNSTVKNPRKFTVLIERDEEGYYVATVPSLRGCHTQARTLDTLMKRTREAIALCLASNGAVPSLELIGIQQVSV